MKTFLWKGLSQQSTERCRIVDRNGQQIVTSEIVLESFGEKKKLLYEIILDEDWVVKSFTVENDFSKSPFYFSARQYEKGKWKNQLDESLTTFDKCIDIDIFPTPFTNTLPLKRQPLIVGEQSDYMMLWIDLVDGEAKTDRQRYRRLDNHVYRFTSLDTNFTADIQFTDDTMVKHYPGLFNLQGEY